MFKLKPLRKSCVKTLKLALQCLGLGFIAIIILSFTTLPFWLYYNLGKVNHSTFIVPDYIIVLGGGGMPSESGLMRTYKATEAANSFSKAKLIIALPGDTCNHESSVNLMRKELIIRGIDSLRITFENKGLNTRMQAIEIFKQLDNSAKLLLITSPDHMYRAIKTFKKAGFKEVCGYAAMERAIECELYFNEKELGGNNFIIEVGQGTQLRYQFWNHLKFQIYVYREYMAIGYYKLKGWI